MIKSNELRIGNWINDGTDSPHKVLEVGETLKTEEGGNVHYSDCVHFHPIPITEDWLKRFNLKHNAHNGWIIREMLNATIYFRFNYLWIDDGYKRMKISTKIEYIHELQNCCKFPIGIELELTK